MIGNFDFLLYGLKCRRRCAGSRPLRLRPQKRPLHRRNGLLTMIHSHRWLRLIRRLRSTGELKRTWLCVGQSQCGSGLGWGKGGSKGGCQESDTWAKHHNIKWRGWHWKETRGTRSFLRIYCYIKISCAFISIMNQLLLSFTLYSVSKLATLAHPLITLGSVHRPELY